MRRIVFFIAISLLPLLASGQEIFRLSLKGGITMSQIDGDNSGSYSKLGFQAGIVNTMYLAGPWYTILEFNVTNKGSYVRKIDRTISLTYVEVPIMLLYRPDEWRLSLAAGVTPGILAKAKVTDGGEYIPSQSDNYRRFDRLPLCVGIDYRFNDHWAAYARHTISLLNISKTRSGTYLLSTKNSGQFNRYIAVGLTYML